MNFLNNIPVDAISHISISNNRFQANEILLVDGSKRSTSDIPVSTRTVSAQLGLGLYTAGNKVRPLLMWEVSESITGGDSVVLPMGLNGSESYFIHDSNTGQCWNHLNNWQSVTSAKKELKL